MALDGLVLHTLVHEFQAFVGGRIHKIHQPADYDIVMQIRAGGKTSKLLLSANPTYPRVHLTKQSFQNPITAPMFCMLLRKHCEQAMIESIEQIGMERMMHINFRHRDELGDIRSKKLIVELTGRHSNIILMDPEENVILDSIQHVNADVSRYRTVLPGSTYISPPDQNKLNPLNVSKEEVSEKFHAIGIDMTPQQLVSMFSGISPLNANEIGFRASNKEKQLIAQQWVDAFNEVMEQIRKNQALPQIKELPNKKTVFSILELTHIEGEAARFETASECLEAYFGEKALKDTVKQKSGNLYKVLQTEQTKNKKKQDILRKTIQEAKQAEKYRIMGELLTAYMHQIQKGQHEIEVINYYDPEQSLIKIPLDTRQTPSENAQRYFKKYTKLKNSVRHAEEQLKLNEEEITYLDNVLQQLEEATLTDLEEIREELEQQGYVRRRNRNNPRKNNKNKRPTLMKYTSSENIPIYVGKNNTQNDFLTNRFAHSSDTWLHTKDIPGSHVVIRSSNYTDITLEEAAMLAAYYSKAKESSQVPVDYTEIRHVRKPSGAKPGFVIYDHQKTIYITPDPKRIQNLQVEQE